MVRRFIFSAAVIAAVPLVILTWLMEGAAKIPLVLFGVWWSLCFVILNDEQRKEYSASWTRFAADFVRSNPGNPWTGRVIAFAEHASRMTTAA